MTQCSAVQGLRKFGEAGQEAVCSEMQQLHEMGVAEPNKGDVLARKEKSRALNHLMFLKQKRCGRIKGRGCACGRKQRLCKNKQETSAPTVAVESLLLSCDIDAKEKRAFVTTDIPGAFMQTDVDEVTRLRLEGPLASLLAKVDPHLCNRCLERDKKGKPAMHVKPKKASCGTLQAAMLFWKDLSANLVKWGHEVNPRDWCVASEMVNGKQCDVPWHVDDLKTSHVDPEAVESLSDFLNGEHGEINPLVTAQGKTRECLGMTLDFSVEGKVQAIMKDCLKEMIDELPEDMAGEAATPAALHLLQVSDKAEKLDKEKAELFHHLTAKLLFVSRRARPDTWTPVAFLTRRAKAPDADNHKKLRRTMQHLRASTWC